MPSTTVLKGSELVKIQECTLPLLDSFALRVYADTRPRNGKIADLQKGLILVHKGVETIGEGTGFGFPVLICSNETYFSEKALVYLSKQKNLTLIRKEFQMDKIARNQFRNLRIENRKLRGLLRYVNWLYQRHKGLRILALKVMYMKMGVHSVFVKTTTVGKVVVTYRIIPGIINVKADFSHLRKERLQRIFMLNEQGSRFFRKYEDAKGMKFADKQIGAWDPIEAEWASLTDLQGVFGFRLRRLENSVLYRGQEFLDGFLDWVGLDYEINPRNSLFEYEIEILGA
jgi:hypothetical protein